MHLSDARHALAHVSQFWLGDESFAINLPYFPMQMQQIYLDMVDPIVAIQETPSIWAETAAAWGRFKSTDWFIRNIL